MITTENFIRRAKQVHGDKYDYSKSEYNGTHIKTTIICPIHGEFLQSPHDHLKGCGCKKCGDKKSSQNRSLTTEEFIERARKVHGDRYDYSKVIYINSHTNVCIIDENGDEFYQTPNAHLNGHGNPQKAYETLWDKRGRITTEEFIERAKKIHGDKYDYSKVNYVNAKRKICVICPIHGEFWVKPYNFLNFKGCYKCGRQESGRKQTMSTTKFIERARKVHGDRYDYSKVEYINNHTPVCIICPIYGEFWQTPTSHLRGSGNPKERYIKLWAKRGRITTEEFIERARKVHGDKYDYSKVEYKGYNTKICITCPIHGEFWQTPSNHLSGKGCAICSMSHLEKDIMQFFQNEKIEYIYNCNKENLPWIKRQHLDFYLPKYKIAIECQGSQHFIPSSFGSKEKTPENCLKSIIERDKRKKLLCKKNGVKILYYSNLGIKYPYFVFENKEELLKNILLNE